MRNRVFNTRFELSLRIIIILSVSSKPVDLEALCVADFVATYGKAFSVADENVNGDNRFMFIEFMSRRSLIQRALKELVLKGYVLPTATNDGIVYDATTSGHQYAESLTSEYAVKYRGVAIDALSYVEENTTAAVITEINRRAEHIGKGA